MEKLKQLVEEGHVELAKLDDKNQPQTVSYSQISEEVSRKQKHAKIYKSLAQLSWDQKYEWVNMKRLKAKEKYQNQQIDEAIQIYIQSLIGVQLKQGSEQQKEQMKHDLQLPITLNIVTCLYRKKQYKKAIHLCDKILVQNPKYLPALYKKAYLLLKNGDHAEAKQQINLGIAISKDTKQQKYLKELIQLNGDLAAQTKKSKSVYSKMFNNNSEDETRQSEQSQSSKLIQNAQLNNQNRKFKKQQQDDGILYYEDEPVSICDKLFRFALNSLSYVVPSMASHKNKMKRILHTSKSL